MSLPPGFAFSQASLQDYADCPRRFQLRYQLGALWPAVHEGRAAWEQRAEQGSAFHLLIHRHVLGIPEDVLESTARDSALTAWWHAYLATPPVGREDGKHRSEVLLSTPLLGHRLIARYDLLVIRQGGRATIVDWKTSERRPARAWLQGRWQTLVYPYVLATSGAGLDCGEAIPPERIELVYWFANFPQQPERFDYDSQEHAAADARLRATIAHILAHDEEIWPLTAQPKRCQYCAYRTLCDREEAISDEKPDLEQEAELLDLDLDLEQIAEIEF